MRNLSALLGAGFGLALFLGIALLPALLYGGYAGVLLAGGIMGTPLQPSLVARGLIVFGMIMASISVASLFMVAGAAIGAAVQVILSVPASVLGVVRK